MFDRGLYPNHVICIDIFNHALPIQHVNGMYAHTDNADQTTTTTDPPE